MARKGGAPDNLKHFKKGQSGNPKGRPKLPDLKEALQNILGETKDGKTALDAIFMALRAKAAKGDVRAAELLMDRAYGKSKQVIDMNASVEVKDISDTKFIIKKKGT
jgi:hypothetical protein